ncbi:MAG: TAXI family TRAP transporter solute-binding subunit [Aeromonadaceae bacterium]|nr:TAXI family TRAP transporter solute-binding subunit [Aeromonadaceae bacterium]
MRPLLCLLCLLLLMTIPSVRAAPPLLIGSGSLTGVYYPAGGALCRLLARAPAKLPCQVVATGGSAENLMALSRGALSLALVQADVQITSTQLPPLYRLFNLHQESLTLVTRLDSGISSLAELANKRLDIGNPGSGDHSTMLALIQALDWPQERIDQLSQRPGSERAQALCDGEIDAFAYVVGHPSSAISEAASLCPIRLLPITGEAVERWLQAHPYYQRTQIPAALYAGVDTAIATIGMPAGLIAGPQIDEALAYRITQQVFHRLPQLKRLHPALSQLDQQQMIGEASGLPLHPGARRFFVEQGWLPPLPDTPPPRS